jgi:phenylacetate-CoA ligase
MTVFDPWATSRAALQIAAQSQAGPLALRQTQALRWRLLLQAARARTRLYRERLRGLPDDTPAAAVPPVSKRELMARFDDAVADPHLSLPALRAFTADPARAGEAYLGRYMVWESSGTTGEPALFVQDAAAMAVYDMLELLRPGWSVRWGPGAGPGGPLLPGIRGLGWPDPWGLGLRYAFVGALGGHFASQVSVQRWRALSPWAAEQVRCFSFLQPLPQLLQGLQDWSPQVIATYPTMAAVLAEQARQGRLALPLRELRTGGETLGSAARHGMAAALGCPVRNMYGASEFLPLAWECAAGRLHLNADWVLLEPVDGQGHPVPAGELSARCLLTNLANHVQPLIRYELGDRILVDPRRCPCGSALPAIEVRGRDEAALVVEGEDGSPVSLLPLALSTVLEEQAGVFDFQLRQLDARTLVLRLAGPPGRARSQASRCHEVLQAYARAQGACALRFVDEPGEAVPRGRSGKALRVVGLAVGRRLAPGAVQA